MSNISQDDPFDDHTPDDESPDPAPDETPIPFAPPARKEGPWTVNARLVTVLDCIRCKPLEAPGPLYLLVALGAGEGTIEQLTISEQDGTKLMRLLNKAITGYTIPPTSPAPAAPEPAKVTTRRRRRKHRRSEDAIWKAEIKWDAEGSERFLQRFKRHEPNLGRYLDQQIQSLTEALLRNCHTSMAAKRIRKSVLRCLCLSLHIAFRFR